MEDLYLKDNKKGEMLSRDSKVAGQRNLVSLYVLEINGPIYFDGIFLNAFCHIMV